MWNLKFFLLNLTLWIQPQIDPANPTTMTGWVGQMILADRTDLMTQTGRVSPTTHTGLASQMS